MPDSIPRPISSISLQRTAAHSFGAVLLAGTLGLLPSCHADMDEMETQEPTSEEAIQAAELGGAFLSNQLSGKCIDGEGAPATNNGASLQLWDCELDGRGPNFTLTDQKWELTAEGFLRNALSGRCLDVEGAPGMNNGARLQLWDCEYNGLGPGFTATDQKWELTSEGFLRNKLSGRCIDVRGAPAVNNGARLQLWDCEWNGLGPGFTATDQKWSWR